MILGRFSHHIIALLLLALLIAAPVLAASEQHVQFAPVVVGQAVQPVEPSTITLITSDTTFISAAHDSMSGRVFVAYIDRKNGNRLHVTELINDRLVEMPAPNIAPRVAPSFTTDAPKDAASALLFIDGWLWLFHSSRAVGDPGGPFQLQLTRWKP